MHIRPATRHGQLQPARRILLDFACLFGSSSPGAAYRQKAGGADAVLHCGNPVTLMPAQRTISDGPFCWQSKGARRLIRERFAELNCVSSALSIYDALCEIASDEEAEAFKASTPTIAATAGVGTRTAQSILPKLEAIGIIDITAQTFPGTNMDAPSIYTLLKLEAEPKTHRNGCAPLSNDCAPLRNGRKQTSLRTSEESGRISEETLSSPSAPNRVEFSPAILESVYQAFPRREGKQPALKSINKALAAVQKRGEPDPVSWMLGRVRAYAESCDREGKEKQHIKMPQGWFNDGRYDDDAQRSGNGNGVTKHAPPIPTKSLPSSKDLYPANP